jgi:hypothetical protein
MLKFVLQKPVWAFCSLALALSSCSTGEVGTGNRPTRFLSVQPIQVCNDFGIFCADLALFEAETKKLWAQADIQVDFLAPVRINGSRFLTIDSQDEFAELSFSGGWGAFGRHPLSTRTSGPINLWFVDRIFDGLVESLGWAWIDQNGVVISDDILGFNNGIGRRDTVAHELGHNLGLTHSNFGAGAPTNLMSDGGVRNIPNSVNDITPDGANLGQLTADRWNRPVIVLWSRPHLARRNPLGRSDFRSLYPSFWMLTLQPLQPTVPMPSAPTRVPQTASSAQPANPTDYRVYGYGQPPCYSRKLGANRCPLSKNHLI